MARIQNTGTSTMTQQTTVSQRAAYWIKPLEWVKAGRTNSASRLTKWLAFTVIGEIEISAGLYHLKETSERFVSGVYFVGSHLPFANDADAKAAAELHYTEKLLTALEPTKGKRT